LASGGSDGINLPDDLPHPPRLGIERRLADRQIMDLPTQINHTGTLMSMTTTTPVRAFAATSPKGPLAPFEYTPGALGADQVEIDVKACGICHSDLSMLDNDWGMSQFPFVGGHEVIGTVAALGISPRGRPWGWGGIRAVA
jgi:hypothetical protein